MSFVLPPAEIRRLVREALREDLGRKGDITSKVVVPASVRAVAQIISRQSSVCAGLPFVQEVYRQLDRGTRVRLRVRDGRRVRKGQVLAEVRGPARALLAGERVSLNFLGRLGGIATLTRRFVDAVGGSRAAPFARLRGRRKESLWGPRAVILDTRKTTPLLRQAEKYAVRIGGGRNHRMGLYDGCLIKDNHIKAAGGIAPAVRRAVSVNGGSVITETENLRQVKEACEAGTSIILLDNFHGSSLGQAVRWVKAHHPRVKIELSGGVNLRNVGRLAGLGVDRISVGALTHSAPSVDLHMSMRLLPRRS
ncbi:MAG: carboxylating nicotinate-nucleotide diphosphorylase [Nitrospirae bacterium]|nr:carboxylating nicotinate-nucleotide diphosphorylase [Nitrospirota bacterium]